MQDCEYGELRLRGGADIGIRGVEEVGDGRVFDDDDKMADSDAKEKKSTKDQLVTHTEGGWRPPPRLPSLQDNVTVRIDTVNRVIHVVDSFGVPGRHD